MQTNSCKTASLACMCAGSQILALQNFGASSLASMQSWTERTSKEISWRSWHWQSTRSLPWKFMHGLKFHLPGSTSRPLQGLSMQCISRSATQHAIRASFWQSKMTVYTATADEKLWDSVIADWPSKIRWWKTTGGEKDAVGWAMAQIVERDAGWVGGLGKRMRCSFSRIKCNLAKRLLNIWLLRFWHLSFTHKWHGPLCVQACSLRFQICCVICAGVQLLMSVSVFWFTATRAENRSWCN